VTGWTWAWIGWLVYFAVVEGAALYRSKPGDTLSEHAWAWLGVGEGRSRSGWTQLRRALLVGFLAWLVLHFMTGGWA
jgi:hypothetical protein